MDRWKVEAALQAAVPAAPSIRAVPVERTPRQAHDGTRYRFIRDVLRVAAERGWEPDYTAHIMLAALASPRVRMDVFGPCHYCGTWLATTVDHVTPRSQGGSNDRANLVSACLPCNSAKGDRTPEEWRPAA